MPPLLDIEGIQCRYGDKVVVNDFGFRLETGRIACLLGPSGCGKTTVLRAIAGFEPVQAGHITLDGRALSTPARQLPPEQRQVGMVFQDYALFPHMTVSENIAFGLHRQAGRDETVAGLLSLVQLSEFADRYPHQLSGGQQQRVALARALAPNPRLLLLDEPFSNLDTELRRSLSVEVRNILHQRNITAILVTHDRTEAFNVADEIGVMVEGHLQQWATAETLYHRPANASVARFICDGRFLIGTLREDGRADTLFGALPVNLSSHFPEGSRVHILIRPWELVHCGVDDARPSCKAEIIQQQFHGAVSLTTLALPDGTQLESSDAHLAGHPPGESLTVCLESPTLLAFD